MPDEIVIADDGSGAYTRDLINKFRAILPVPLHHVWHEDTGFRKSLILNKAIKVASGDYIIQIDGDVILDKNFVKDHLSIAEEGTLVRGTRAHISEKLQPELFINGQINFSFYSPGVKHRFNALRIPQLAWFFAGKKKSSKSVRGCNLAFWKKDFIAVNGYNNDLQGWGHEDEELAARLVNSGIMKKCLKLKGVQYHLSHRIASRSQEDKHDFILRKTLEKHVKYCNNGYLQICEPNVAVK